MVDDENEWILNNFTSPNYLIKDFDKFRFAYDKHEHMLKKMAASIKLARANFTLHKWGAEAAGRIIKTQGADKPATGGATGVRKKVTLDDFANLVQLMVADDVLGNSEEISGSGLVCVVPAGMYRDLFGIPEFVDASKFASAEMLKSGLVGRLLGFDIYTRSSTIRYSNASTPVKKALGSAVAATDVEAIVAWHESSVVRAANAGKVYDGKEDSGYQGVTFSANQFAGAKARKNQKGLAVIVQQFVS
jgi:hypothetical protein